MRALITGGAGFIGSHLISRLLADGGSVVAFDNLSTGCVENVARHVDDRRCELVVGDVRDEHALARAADGCDVIFHLAAAVGVRLILTRPLDAMLTNLRGVENVLELAARRRLPVLVASTSEVYGNADADDPLEEDGPRRYGSTRTLRWSYAGAKAAGEMLALAYRHELGLQTVIVRFFNVSGPRQTGHYGMVVPTFVAQALSGRPITVFGDGSQTRCFVHVTDAVDALVRLMRTPAAAGRVVNIGSEAEVTINELASIVRRVTGSSSEIVHIPYALAYGPGYAEIQKRRPCLDLVRSLVGHEPLGSVTDIVRDIVADIVGRGAVDDAPSRHGSRAAVPL